MSVVLGDALVLVGPIVLAALFVWGRFFPPGWLAGEWPVYALAGLGALWLLFAVKHAVWDRFKLARTCGRIKKQLRVLSRSPRSWAKSLRQLPAGCRDPEVLPIGETDEVRYSLFSRLRRLIGAFGYTGMLVVIDRVDEPTLVSGDADRMRAIVWPLLNNKFLQQEGLGVKMLLPVELRHALFRESSAFFQDARLDKQNMIERLDVDRADAVRPVQHARCRRASPAGSAQLALLDLFSEDVTRQDVVDALDQMHQPRDGWRAFKFLYRCMTEHGMLSLESLIARPAKCLAVTDYGAIRQQVENRVVREYPKVADRHRCLDDLQFFVAERGHAFGCQCEWATWPRS
jgi:hypothetical protein